MSKKKAKKSAKTTRSRSEPPTTIVKKSKKSTVSDPLSQPAAVAKLPIQTDQHHEAMRHILGANVPRTGERIDNEEEATRLRALQMEATFLAAQVGLDIKPLTTYSPEATPTQRAKEIKDIAGPLMNEAADEFSFSRTRLKITDAHGRSIEAVKTEIKARAILKESIGGIARVVAAPFKFATGLTIKVGQWLHVQLFGKGEAE